MVDTLVQDSYSPRTLLAYARGWQRFLGFLRSMELPRTLPVQREHIALYLAALKKEGLAPGSIRSALSTIAWKHKLLGVRDPTKDFLLTRVMEGLRRARPHPPNRVLPITADILHRLLDALPGSVSAPYDATLMRAFFLLAYHGAFRVGELCESGTLVHTIKREDVSMGQGEDGRSIRLRLTSFKFSKEEAIILLHPDDDGEHCPVRALSNYLCVRPPLSGPLFLKENGAPLRRVKVAATLKSCAILAGLDAEKFNTHSLRVGRATDLAAAGASEALIRETGRWTSNAYLKYIRFKTFELPPPPPFAL